MRRKEYSYFPLSLHPKRFFFSVLFNVRQGLSHDRWAYLIAKRIFRIPQKKNSPRGKIKLLFIKFPREGGEVGFPPSLSFHHWTRSGEFLEQLEKPRVPLFFPFLLDREPLPRHALIKSSFSGARNLWNNQINFTEHDSFDFHRSKPDKLNKFIKRTIKWSWKGRGEGGRKEGRKGRAEKKRKRPKFPAATTVI